MEILPGVLFYDPEITTCSFSGKLIIQPGMTIGTVMNILKDDYNKYHEFYDNITVLEILRR